MFGHMRSSVALRDTTADRRCARRTRVRAHQTN